MSPTEQHPDERRPLAQISTAWSIVLRAKGGTGVSEPELVSFFASYRGAVYRYFLTSLGRNDIAEDLTQDFALRFVRGDFSNVHPDRGRFRDFLRVALANQLRDYRRRQKLRGGKEVLEADPPEPEGDSDAGAGFDENWRDELLAQTWTALEQHQQATGQMYFTALKLKATETPRLGVELAELFSKQTQSVASDEAFRKVLQRARRRFGELLLRLVADTLAIPTRDELEHELAELKLLAYCRELLPERA